MPKSLRYVVIMMRLYNTIFRSIQQPGSSDHKSITADAAEGAETVIIRAIIVFVMGRVNVPAPETCKRIPPHQSSGLVRSNIYPEASGAGKKVIGKDMSGIFHFEV